jgi:hypothetical protein
MTPNYVILPVKFTGKFMAYESMSMLSLSPSLSSASAVNEWMETEYKPKEFFTQTVYVIGVKRPDGVIEFDMWQTGAKCVEEAAKRKGTGHLCVLTLSVPVEGTLRQHETVLRMVEQMVKIALSAC